jgi:hypothetical protein
MYRYHSLLQKHALGNFKTFVSEIGLTPAMLIFLNNIQNTRFQPNENYARELLELFTLGVDNGYTQMDITNVARAITGWNGIDQTNLCGDVTFVQPFWDPGQKTIFGKTGNWGYDDVINLLFTERAVQISEYICRKLYVDFVNPDVNEDMVKLLAKVFRDNNFEIAPVMKALLQSEHFFDDANVGTIIPGHIAYFLTFLNEIGYQEDKELLYAVGYSASEFNEQIFNPTDVAGWPGNRNWITTNSFPYRVEGILNIIRYNFNLNGEMLEEYRAFAKGLTMASESNAEKVCRAIVDYILPNGLQKESDYQDALAVFKAEIPENYFELGLWNLDWEYAPAQVVFLIVHLSNMTKHKSYKRTTDLSDIQAHNHDHKLWSRRSFLQTIGMAGGVGFGLGGLGISALTAAPISLASGGNNDRILVLIRLKGGNDGLNMIVPTFDYGTYKANRPTIAINQSDLLSLGNGSFSIPKTMSKLMPMWDSGAMKIINSVGYPDHNLSHFTSSDIWNSANENIEQDQNKSGWLGRLMLNERPDYLTNLPEIPGAIKVSSGSNITYPLRS